MTNEYSAIGTQYPIMTKQKQVFRNFCNKKIKDALLWDSKLSSGASCFHWSSLKCFYNLIGVHLVGNSNDWTWFGKAHTCLYKGPTGDGACQSKNQAIRSKELSVELRDRIVSSHRSREGYRKMSAALKVPKNTVASIIFKWMMFGTPKTQPRAWPNWAIGGERPWSGRWPRTWWSRWQFTLESLWRWENLPEGQPSLKHSTNQDFMVEWPDGSRSSVKSTWQPAWSLPKDT